MGYTKFSFRFVSLNEIFERDCKLNPKRASQATDVSVKIITENKDTVSFYLNNFNNALFQVTLF